MRLSLSSSSVMATALWVVLVAWQVPSRALGDMMQPEELYSENGKLAVTLTVDWLESLHGLPGGGFRRAPAYNGKAIGPTLRVKPGDKVRVTLVNKLEPGTDLDRELYQYLKQDDIDDVNATVIANRLSKQGTMHKPAYGFWGLNYVNLHFHGLQVSPSVEDTFTALDGGESKTYTFSIPGDQEPGLYWYHDQVHGKVAYSFMSSLYGFLVVEGTDENDLTRSQGVKSATECLLLLSETYVDPDSNNNSPPPFFPTVGVFNWVSVTNGNLATSRATNELAARQGEKVLFRVASATVEPTMRLFVRDHKMLVLAYDGKPLPGGPVLQDYVEVSGGGRVEFLIKFQQAGDFVMERAAWRYLPPTKEACQMELGVSEYPCSSFDTLKDVLLINVQANAFVSSTTRAADNYDLARNMQLPGVSRRLEALAQLESVATKTVYLNRETRHPLFQFPASASSAMADSGSALGYGINGRLFNPTQSAGTVTAGTCETWNVVSDMASLQHPFHVDAAVFMVQELDGAAVDEPFWRDTMPVPGSMTIHICFDRVEGGDKLLVHSHAPNHWDSGMATYYDVIAPPSQEKDILPLQPDDEDVENDGAPDSQSGQKSAASDGRLATAMLLVSSCILMAWSM